MFLFFSFFHTFLLSSFLDLYYLYISFFFLTLPPPLSLSLPFHFSLTNILFLSHSFTHSLSPPSFLFCVTKCSFREKRNWLKPRVNMNEFHLNLKLEHCDVIYREKMNFFCLAYDTHLVHCIIECKLYLKLVNKWHNYTGIMNWNVYVRATLF